MCYNKWNILIVDTFALCIFSPILRCWLFVKWSSSFFICFSCLENMILLMSFFGARLLAIKRNVLMCISIYSICLFCSFCCSNRKIFVVLAVFVHIEWLYVGFKFTRRSRSNKHQKPLIVIAEWFLYRCSACSVDFFFVRSVQFIVIVVGSIYMYIAFVASSCFIKLIFAVSISFFLAL